MAARTAMAVVAALGLLATAAAAQQEERSVPIRSFEGFERDSETVTGFWAEAGALYQEDEDDIGGGVSADIKATTPFARFAYGGSKWEAGLLLPYRVLDADVHLAGTTASADEDGIGDIQLVGKYVPVRNNLIDLGAGLQMSLPTGDDDKSLGSGEVGFMPFVTGAIHVAVLDFRAHVGNMFFTGSGSKAVSTDRLVYGLGFYAPIGKYVALRNEFSGAEYHDLPSSPKAVSYLPGIDVRIPIGEFDLLVRPTGSVGVSEHAPDWGVGASITIASPTMRAATAAGPGGIVIE